MSEREPIEINAVSKLVEWVEDYQANLGLLERPEIWFRGQSDTTWKIEPGALRKRFIGRAWKPSKDNGDFQREDSFRNEIKLNNKFRLRASSVLSTREDLVDLYFLPSIMASKLGSSIGPQIPLSHCSSPFRKERRPTGRSLPPSRTVGLLQKVKTRTLKCS